MAAMLLALLQPDDTARRAVPVPAPRACRPSWQPSCVMRPMAWCCCAASTRQAWAQWAFWARGRSVVGCLLAAVHCWGQCSSALRRALNSRPAHAVPTLQMSPGLLPVLINAMSEQGAFQQDGEPVPTSGGCSANGCCRVGTMGHDGAPAGPPLPPGLLPLCKPTPAGWLATTQPPSHSPPGCSGHVSAHLPHAQRGEKGFAVCTERGSRTRCSRSGCAVGPPLPAALPGMQHCTSTPVPLPLRACSTEPAPLCHSLASPAAGVCIFERGDQVPAGGQNTHGRGLCTAVRGQGCAL